MRIIIYMVVGLLLSVGYFLFLEIKLFMNIFGRWSYFLSINHNGMLLFGIFLETGANWIKVFLTVFIPISIGVLVIGLLVNTITCLIGKKVKIISRYSALIVTLTTAFLFELILRFWFYSDLGGTWLLTISNYMVIQFWSPIGLTVFVIGSLLLEFLVNIRAKRQIGQSGYG